MIQMEGEQLKIKKLHRVARVTQAIGEIGTGST